MGDLSRDADVHLLPARSVVQAPLWLNIEAMDTT
jgi:hypothetical protein